MSVLQLILYKNAYCFKHQLVLLYTMTEALRKDLEILDSTVKSLLASHRPLLERFDSFCIQRVAGGDSFWLAKVTLITKHSLPRRDL
jgi:hypothetical protein